MRFGLHYHQHLLAKWADDYVDYNGLRQMIRLASQRKEPPADVLKCLEENMKSFEAFHEKKLTSIIQREADLCAIIGLPSTPADIPDIDTVEQSELGLILFFYEDLLREVYDIEGFDRVNEAAITKVFAKFANGFEDETSYYHHLQSQWLAMQQSLESHRTDTRKRFSNIIADVRRVCSMTRQPTRSLYINACIRVDSAPENSYDWIKNDQVAALREYYLSCDPPTSLRWSEFERQLYSLFIAAIMMEAKESANFLLELVTEKGWAMDIDQIFFLFSLCGHMKQNGSRATPTPEDWLVKLLDGPCALTTVFLRRGGVHGRLALYYAAKYGLKSFCEASIRCATNSDVGHLADLLPWRDNDGMTPLHYAVLSGETSVLAILLKWLVDSNDIKQSKSDLQPLFGNLLLLSVRSGQDDIANILLDHQPDINYTAPHGETALYCAAQANNLGLIKLLLTYTQCGLDANIATATGWTPLMVACANGHRDVVSCLLEAGVEPESCDALGWTAREHAVFRGHLGIATLLTSTTSETTNGGPASSHRLAYKNPRQTSFSESSERLVVVNLGSTQGGHDRAAFELSHYIPERSSGPKSTSSLVLEISAPGTEADAKLVRLPILEDQINQPFIFQAKNEAPLQISVRLFRRESMDSMVLLSRGNTTLDHGKVFFGKKRESMVREVTIFMMDKETMDLTGTVLLSYVVATPFAGLQQPDTTNYQRRLGDPMRIVGHRDLQITRDLEAVIFHDFSLSESGTDVAIHDVTLSQYKHASDLQEPQSITPAAIDTRSGVLHGSPQRRRAWSTGEESRLRTAQLRDRLRYTVDFQSKGFKPNTRGDFIQGSLATLDELLMNLPEDIGFNIEMKYPRLHEAVDAGVAPVTIDINTFVDVALEKIQRLAGNRPIILSSFTPEVCILLSVKQKTYPVMFITNAGKVPMADKELRVASLQVGVQFARLWNLAGVVFACEALLYCPRLVQFVKNAGLVCASYGLLNNEPMLARKQADAGVDIIMVDRVKLVAEELAKDGTMSNTSLN
ncbi:glycerophosphodiester phosphodiesterase [Trichoderma asperellum]